MEDQLITFETAKLAKEKGFDWAVSWYATHKRKAPTNPDSFYPELSTFKNWNDNEGLKFYERYSLPTQSLLQKWLREVHNLHIQPIYNKSTRYCIRLNDECENAVGNMFEEYFETYEKALEEGLQEALKLI